MNYAGENAKAGRAPAQIDDSNPLTALEARIMNNANAAEEVANQLEQLADRLLGSVPESDTARGGVSRHYANGGVGRCHDAVGYLDSQMSRIATAAGRLSILGE